MNTIINIVLIWLFVFWNAFDIIDLQTQVKVLELEKTFIQLQLDDTITELTELKWIKPKDTNGTH